jgi:4-amino-4-deoxy-L-arabinose transferase-like glycosyltransferase
MPSSASGCQDNANKGGGVDGPSLIEKALARAPLVVTAFQARVSFLALLALCLAVYMPGVMRLPAVDRTEVVFAETTRDMLARGAIADPRYGDTVHPFRPIGTYWAQARFAWLAGETHARDITIYRLPAMIAVTLAVLALYLLASPLIGSNAALIAAALFAVAPLTVLVAHLAIAEGLSLFPATVAMLALLRVYAAPKEESTRTLAWLFWLALGLGILINALLVPILVAVALIALRFLDRDIYWMQRLNVATGLPVALLIASPWLFVRVMQDGVPFAGLSLQEFTEALGGSQDMKLRAWPGTFVLAVLLGFLPGTALLAPACKKLWDDRHTKITRFLLAWVIGYLVYLELLSSKPGTYMVQPLFPALAIAVGMLVVSENGKKPVLKFHAIPWPPLAAVLPLALFALPFVVLREMPKMWLALPVVAVVALFYWSAVEGRYGHLYRWAQISVAALGLFAVTLLACVLPSIDQIWPTRQVERAIAACKPSRLGVLGFNEPTSRFILNRDSELSTREGFARLADGTVQGLAVVSDRWYNVDAMSLSAEQKTNIRQFACLPVVNTMRGCALSLMVVGNKAAPACATPAEFACISDIMVEPTTSPLKACD